MKHSPLYLKKREEQRLIAGHVWIYSNEIDTARSPLASFQPGQLVNVLRSDGKGLGTAYINPHSLICARLISSEADCAMDVAFFTQRINTALRLRQTLFAKPFYRLVHAEGDALPGLIIDRFGDACVVQTNTAGMSSCVDAIVDALNVILKPQTIILRNDSSIRAQEGLSEEVRVIQGVAPESVNIEENDTGFLVPMQSGQKTGWFYDHRMNRLRMQAYIQDKRVLDVFSYHGGWSVQAAKHGASRVTAVDSSQVAIDGVRRNAELNGVGDKVATICDDAFDGMEKLVAAKQKFDVVVVDPPAFIKRKKDFDAGFSAYQRINGLALSLLDTDGLLIASSCSYHLSVDDLRRAVLKASRKSRVNLQMLEQGAQAPDHPVHPAIPETAYLKSLFFRVLDNK